MQRLRVLGDPGAGVMGMVVTDAAMMPAVGAATYTGGATIRVETATPLVLYGDATLNVDFGGDAITGDLTRFFGTTASGGIADYAGEINISGSSAAQDAVLDYSGALSAGGQSLTFDGTADGVFLGAMAEAFALSDLTADVIVGGMMNEATLVVVTEATGPPE